MVVSERLGHATAAFTIETYQHVMPGVQAAHDAFIGDAIAQADRRPCRDASGSGTAVSSPRRAPTWWRRASPPSSQ